MPKPKPFFAQTYITKLAALRIRILLTRRMAKTGEGRQTAMFSATFGTGVQHLAADFLDAYTFVAVGRVGSAAQTVSSQKS